jgi:hypothetical protein
MPERIKKEAVFFRDKIIDDLAGSEEKLTGAELMLLDRAVNIYGVIRKIELHIARRGVIDEKGNLAPILANNYITYVNSLRLTLRELGIKRRVEDLLTPAELIKEIEKGD